MTMHVRILTPDDIEAYWTLRLQALQRFPESFGASYEEAAQTPMERVRERISATPEHFVAGAFDETGRLIGMLGFRRETALKMRHKAILWGMYVDPAHQGKGVGRALLREVIGRANRLDGVERIHLLVVTTNEAAVNLYRSFGFRTYGTERDAMRIGGRSYDEHLMVLELGQPSAEPQVSATAPRLGSTEASQTEFAQGPTVSGRDAGSAAGRTALAPDIRRLRPGMIAEIEEGIARAGHRRRERYFHECVEQNETGERVSLVAFVDGRFAGFGHLLFASKYPFFRENGIPEVNDLLVLPEYRKRGVATALLLEAEKIAASRGDKIGIGVGLYRDYGAAQRLYASLGYVPDGRGIMYGNEPVTPGEMVRVDDKLVLYWWKRIGKER